MHVAGQMRFVRLLLFTSRAHNDDDIIIIIERYEYCTEDGRTRNIIILICFYHYHTYCYCNIICTRIEIRLIKIL